MAGKVYRVTHVVGTSEDSVGDAIRTAVSTASKTIHRSILGPPSARTMESHCHQGQCPSAAFVHCLQATAGHTCFYSAPDYLCSADVTCRPGCQAHQSRPRLLLAVAIGSARQAIPHVQVSFHAGLSTALLSIPLRDVVWSLISDY